MSPTSRPASAAAGHVLAPLDIVLVRTGRDAFYAVALTTSPAAPPSPRTRPAGCSTAACA